jgi:hypothetical protein
MRFNARRALSVLSVWAMMLPVAGFGQAAPSHAPPNTPNVKRIEGTLARVDGGELLLRAKGGTTETYQLSPAVQIVLAQPAHLSDLSSGKSIGCTEIFRQGDKVLAGECHIFPDGMRDTVESHATAALSTPTISGTISEVRENVGAPAAQGRTVFVQIAGEQGQTTMTVSSLTQITSVRPGDASALKSGVKVRGVSEQAADGTGVIQMLTVISAVHRKP